MRHNLAKERSAADKELAYKYADGRIELTLYPLQNVRPQTIINPANLTEKCQIDSLLPTLFTHFGPVIGKIVWHAFCYFTF